MGKAEMLTAARKLTSAMHQTAGPAEFTKFAIKGSTALMVHGVDVTPGDIDMLAKSIPHAQRAVKEMGYMGKPTAFNLRVPQEGPLPQLDVLHAADWGRRLDDTRLMYGVRVTSRESLMRDLANDDREDKRERNEAALQSLQEQAERERATQIVPYRGR